MNIKNALILCAGFGKRLLPLTNEKPKPLLSIGSKLLIDYSISFLHKIGIEEILINTHHLHDKFEDFKKERETNIETIFNFGGTQKRDSSTRINQELGLETKG